MTIIANYLFDTLPCDTFRIGSRQNKDTSVPTNPNKERGCIYPNKPKSSLLEGRISSWIGSGGDEGAFKLKKKVNFLH